MSIQHAEPETYDRQCDDCEHLFNADEHDNPGYECGRCGGTFTYTDAGDSRRCPECHIFAAKVAETTCPECGSIDITEGEFTPPPPPTPEQVAAVDAKRATVQAKRDAEMDEYRTQLAVTAERWQTLGPPLLAVVPDLYAPGALADGASGVGIRIEEAEALAAAILGIPVPAVPVHAAGNWDAYDAITAERHSRWEAPDGLAEAFRGLPSGSEWRGNADLGDFMRNMFGRDRSSGTSLRADAWVAIARRLLERAHAS